MRFVDRSGGANQMLRYAELPSLSNVSYRLIVRNGIAASKSKATLTAESGAEKKRQISELSRENN